MNIDGMKILFIGILTEDVISQTKNDGLIGSIVDINEAVQEVGKICNAYNAVNIDFTVLLTHIGFEEDKKLAEKLDPAWGVDVIIGGHSHTFIEKPEKVNDILIVQAGTGTDQIGRFDITIDTDNNCVDSFQWECVPINRENCPKDEALEEIIRSYKSKTDRKYGRLVTRFKRQLTHPSRYRETELGGLFSDILCDSLGLDIMLLGSGSVRNTELGPIVLYSDLAECFPYDGPLYMLRVAGAQLKRMILFMLRDEVWEGSHCEFYQFSKGVRVVYNRAEHCLREFTLNGEEICDERIYKIGLQYFHFNNVENFFSVPLEEISQNGKPRMVSTSCRVILDEYLSSHQGLDRKISGRLIVE